MMYDKENDKTALDAIEYGVFYVVKKLSETAPVTYANKAMRKLANDDVMGLIKMRKDIMDFSDLIGSRTYAGMRDMQ